MTPGGTKIKSISDTTEYYFGLLSAEEEIDPNDYVTIGSSVNYLKKKLKKDGGKYLGQDLTWWKENTKTIFDESILDFSGRK